ncbi:8960_t:CDS:2 [Racocetra fulgida]|uniref:8960_t:CDS:1 n=1 Tax=Racocetra fulgida TaxID=60492 RepID=A0A9N8WAJ2_9GLOM|nr:8960_t:CDS:2 [Racocetra fulgida]
MAFPLVQVSWVYWRLRRFPTKRIFDAERKFIAKNTFELFFIHAPFSLYHAWILVIAVLTVYATFTPDRAVAYDAAAIETVTNDTTIANAATVYESPSIFVQILVILGLLFMECTAIGYIERFRGDIAGAAVIAWTLYGIWYEQQDAVIRWTAFVLALITTFHICKPIILKYVFKKDVDVIII